MDDTTLMNGKLPSDSPAAAFVLRGPVGYAHVLSVVSCCGRCLKSRQFFFIIIYSFCFCCFDHFHPPSPSLLFPLSSPSMLFLSPGKIRAWWGSCVQLCAAFPMRSLPWYRRSLHFLYISFPGLHFYACIWSRSLASLGQTRGMFSEPDFYTRHLNAILMHVLPFLFSLSPLYQVFEEYEKKYFFIKKYQDVR